MKRLLHENYMKMKLKNKKDYSFDYHDELLAISVEQSPLWELIRKTITAQTDAVEEYLKLRIRSKPLYLPNFLWKFILSKLVYLEYFK